MLVVRCWILDVELNASTAGQMAFSLDIRSSFLLR